VISIIECSPFPYIDTINFNFGVKKMSNDKEIVIKTGH